MWYFIVNQNHLANGQYQWMQKLAALTEVEAFNDPYDNFCLFEVASQSYREAMDYLDLEGIAYELSSSKPTRDELLEKMC